MTGTFPTAPPERPSSIPPVPSVLAGPGLRAEARVIDTAALKVARAAVDDTTAPPDDENTGSVGELWLYGVVGGWWRGFDAESVSNALRELDVDTLYVRIHSPGGHAYDGVAIGNLLRNHKARVVTVIDGLAASAASVIAIAGDEIVMCPGSQMMLHDASTYGYGNAATLRRAADWIDGQSQNYAGVYHFRAPALSVEQWREVMVANDGDGTWYTAEAAVSAGLADSVGTRIAVGSPPVAPEDDWDDEDTWARAAHDLQLLEQCVHPAARAAWRGDRPAPTKPPSASAVGSHHPEGVSAMSLSDQAVTTLRTKLGIAGDADEATILAALDEALDERAEPGTAPTVKAGEVVVPEVRMRDLEAAAATGVEAMKELRAMKREAFLDEHKSKFPATSRADWGKRFDKDPEGTRELLTSAADLVPTNELGHEIDADAQQGGQTLETVRQSDTYKNWEM